MPASRVSIGFAGVDVVAGDDAPAILGQCSQEVEPAKPS